MACKNCQPGMMLCPEHSPGSTIKIPKYDVTVKLQYSPKHNCITHGQGNCTPESCGNY